MQDESENAGAIVDPFAPDPLAYAEGRNAAAADSEAVTRAQREGVQRVYDRLIREHVHDRW